MQLDTRYLGLDLANPLIASASPLTRELDDIRRLEDAGAAAVVMASIYEEEILADDAAYAWLSEQGAHMQPEAADYFPELPAYAGGLEARLETLRRAVEAVDIPVIASLNGSTHEGWVEFARELERAGAAAIELNLYRVPADLRESGEALEGDYVDIVRTVRQVVKIPVAVKLGPWFSSPGHMVLRLVEAGANGAVLFNRFHEPDIDLATLQPQPDLQLSNPHEIRLPLMWISLLCGKVDASLAATSGVTGYEEVVKYLLAGADVVMTTSSLLRHGPGHLRRILAGVEEWLAGRGFTSVSQARGLLSAGRLADPEPLLRAQYVKILTGYRAQPQAAG
jgi:dihydroorotate dehydrogenase (fumarate)